MDTLLEPVVGMNIKFRLGKDQTKWFNGIITDAWQQQIKVNCDFGNGNQDYIFSYSWWSPDNINIVGMQASHYRSCILLKELYDSTESLMSSLNEYVRQSMHFNPEWSYGINKSQLSMRKVGMYLRNFDFSSDKMQNHMSIETELSKATELNMIYANILNDVLVILKNLSNNNAIDKETSEIIEKIIKEIDSK